MARCSYCGTLILFGGKRAGALRFCCDTCYENRTLLSLADQISEVTVFQQVIKVHSGNCPLCRGPGPVDVHVSHKVWSAILLTSWSSEPQISCRACGMKSQLGNALFSALVGWWGFPWGFVMTPIQVVRNFFGILRGPDPSEPSRTLHTLVRRMLAMQLVERGEISPT